MTRHRFYTPAPAYTPGDVLELPPDESRHASRSLRLTAGDVVEIFNGKGDCALAEVKACPRHAPLLVAVHDILPPLQGETQHRITLALPLLKSDKLDDVFSAATQLGTFRFALFSSAFCVSNPDGGAIEKRLERWRRIIIEAAAVSGRTVIPDIVAPVPFGVLLSRIPAGTKSLMPWEGRTDPLLSEILKGLKNGNQSPASHVILITGPEGGFHPEEASAARAAGVHLCSLGPRILRAEIAPLAALSIILSFAGEI